MGGKHSSPTEGAENPLTSALRANYHVAHALYQVISEAQEGDLCMSPALLQLPLGALASGASGPARSQLHSLLLSGSGKTDQHYSARALNDYLHGMKDVILASAHRMYIPDTMKIEKEWFVSSTKCFSLCIKPVSFIKSQEELQTSINNWVRSKTKNQIDELISPGTVYSLLQLLLVCAAYFHCDLEYPFTANNTTSDLFYVNAQETRPVKLMHQVNTFRYTELEKLKCQVLEMPYKNTDLRFIVLLPFNVDGLPALEHDFIHIDFVELLENMVYTKILVSIPSFRLQESYDLCNYLDKMGLSSLSCPSERPFLKISEEDPPASLTHFNHMLAFNFMEDNRESVLSRKKKLEIEVDTVVFRADHSFMFVVLDATMNMILIIGRINCLNRFMTPTLQKIAFDQLGEQCQLYLDEQKACESQEIREYIDETAEAAEETEGAIDLRTANYDVNGACSQVQR